MYDMDKFNKFNDVLTEKFKEKHISEECPYCHSTDWLLMDWERNGTYIKPAKKIQELGNPFIMLTCANCGSIRFIAPYVLGLLQTEDSENGHQ